MIRKRKVLVGVIVLAALAVLVLLVGPALQRSVFYPKPHSLPPVVPENMDQLLARLQARIETNAPVMAQTLQPGLSDSEISALEAKGGFRLSDELRALYRWHNGSAATSPAHLLAGQRFLSLDDVVAERMIMQQAGRATMVQRAALAIFAGHRKGWVHVLDDGAGDGYFFDPNRSAAEGAFFYYFAEGNYYIWFPSLRNFVAGVIECYETGAIKVDSDGHTLHQDFQATYQVLERLGSASQ